MFEKYLAEATKTYSFRIGVAGQLPDDFADQLETVMQKYSVVNMSNGKKTPITERPLYFPQLQNEHVTFFEVEVNYPTTPEALQEYIGYNVGVPQSHIVVVDPNVPQEIYQQKDTKDDVYTPVLGTEEMGQSAPTPEAQAKVGGLRVMNLLAELEKARKENEVSPIASVKQDKEQKQMSRNDAGDPTSPIGSK